MLVCKKFSLSGQSADLEVLPDEQQTVSSGSAICTDSSIIEVGVSTFLFLKDERKNEWNKIYQSLLSQQTSLDSKLRQFMFNNAFNPLINLVSTERKREENMNVLCFINSIVIKKSCFF